MTGREPTIREQQREILRLLTDISDGIGGIEERIAALEKRLHDNSARFRQEVAKLRGEVINQPLLRDAAEAVMARELYRKSFMRNGMDEND